MTMLMSEWQKRFGVTRGNILSLAVNAHGAVAYYDHHDDKTMVKIDAIELLNMVDHLVENLSSNYEKRSLEQVKIIAEQEALIQKFSVIEKERMSEENLALKANIEELTGQLKEMASLKESIIASMVQQIKE